MSSEKWWAGRMVGVDTETTDKDPHEARIVTASVVDVQPGQRPSYLEWIVDPGVEIPADAAEMHGWTNERVIQAVGGENQALRVHIDSRGRRTEMRIPKDGALGEIAGHVGTRMFAEVPIVIFNAAYDCTVIEAELARNGIDTLAARPAGIRGVVDPMVIEKQWEPKRRLCYNRGSGGTCDRAAAVHHCSGCRGGRYQCGGCGARDRKLTGLAQHYGIVLASAHSSSADAIAAVRLAARLGKLWPDAGRLNLSTLHQKQVEWRHQQQLGLRQWFDQNGIEHDGCCGEWPVHSRCVPASAVA